MQAQARLGLRAISLYVRISWLDYPYWILGIVFNPTLSEKRQIVRVNILKDINRTRLSSDCPAISFFDRRGHYSPFLLVSISTQTDIANLWSLPEIPNNTPSV